MSSRIEVPPLVPVHFESVPEDAVVMVDHMRVCRTPCTHHMHAGSHKVSMQKKWYLRDGKEMTLNKDDRVKFVLEEKPHRVDALVVKSQSFKLYDQAIRGFQETFKGSINVITLGLFTLVINALMLMLTVWFSDSLRLEGGIFASFFTAFIAAIIISIISTILSLFLPD